MIEGTEITYARIKAGRMRQRDLADKLGIPMQYLSEIENGKRFIGDDVAEKLIEIFPELAEDGGKDGQ